MDDELIGNQAAADYVGLPAPTWRSYRRKDLTPPERRTENRAGHAMPVWTKADLDDWKATRPGRGGKRREWARS